jgi:hypothetical protein
MKNTDERRVRHVAISVALGVGLLIWALVFDMWLGQVERQYLWEQARHELHRGPGAALKVVMAQGIRDGALVATGWSALVVSAILGVAWYAGRVRVRASRDSRS